MLIGIDASRALRATRTGTENYSFNLIRALLGLESGHRIRLYAPLPPTPELAAQLGPAEWRIIPFPRLWTHVRLSLELLLAPPDALFVPAHVLPLVHRRRGIVTVHDLGYLHYPQAHPFWQRLYLDWGTRWSVAMARHIVADSFATRDDLVARYGVRPERVTVAYPGSPLPAAPVDTERDDQVRQRWRLGTDYILSVGTIQPRKNLIVLLDAFAALCREGRLPRETQLVLAGRAGWLSEATLARAAAPDLRDRVVLTGYVSDDDLLALYRGARLLAFPSLYEGFGLPVLEAMQCGLPIVCSRASSLPEVAGDAALLVDPHDVGGWATALESVYHDGALRAELAVRGQAQAATFTWERCARTVLAAIEEML
jgi:glycosyltransferase involved in cell wall biosynthesis